MPVPFGSFLPQPDFTRTASSTPRMRAASIDGGTGAPVVAGGASAT